MLRRKLAIAGWAVHGQWAVALFKPGRKNQCGKIGAVVNVEVREQEPVVSERAVDLMRLKSRIILHGDNHSITKRPGRDSARGSE